MLDYKCNNQCWTSIKVNAWVLIIKNNNGMKELPHGHKNCSHILLFDGYIKVRESLYTQVIIWINTILNHIDTRTIYPSLLVLTWYTYPNGIKNNNTIK